MDTPTRQNSRDSTRNSWSKNAGWFDEQDTIILNLVKTKNDAHLTWTNNKNSATLKSNLSDAKSTLQRAIRQMKNSW